MHPSGHNWYMRFLTIVRHAESTPAPAGGSDRQRTLSARGEAQCAQLRAWALDADALGAYGPVTALVSAATRTTQTFNESFADTPFVADVEFSSLIYNGHRDVTADDLLIDLAAIDPVTTSLLTVAHNPTVTELLATLLGGLPASAHEGIPVGGAYVLRIKDNEPVGRTSYEFVTAYLPD